MEACRRLTLTGRILMNSGYQVVTSLLANRPVDPLYVDWGWKPGAPAFMLCRRSGLVEVETSHTIGRDLASYRIKPPVLYTVHVVLFNIAACLRRPLARVTVSRYNSPPPNFNVLVERQ